MLSLIKFFCSVLSLISFFLFVGVLLCFFKKTIGKYFFGIAIALFFIFSTPTIPNLLINSLENDYLVLSELETFSEDSVHIIILGGGHKSNNTLPANIQLSSSALGRLIEGIRISRLIPKSKIISSGGNGSQPKSQAEVQKQAAISLGVSRSKIAMLPLAKNTLQEAEHYKTEFGNETKLIVVTDACHLPRAIYAFQKIGLHPIPAPTNHYLKNSSDIFCFSILPNTDNLIKTNRAIYEYLGKIWYSF
ncbi:MAG: ElyC/SanA/YdcF family protein [Saprospiraceae bacterium]